MKRLPVVVLSLFLLGVPVASAADPPAWNVSGTYGVTFVCTAGCTETYEHTMTLSDTAGVVTGSGYLTADNAYTWTLTGTVSGSSVTFDIEWTGPAGMEVYNPLLLTGTIDSSGAMSGTASDNGAREFTWTTSGATAAPLATHMVFTSYPGSPSASELGDIVVEIRDVNDDVVSDARSVTLSMNANGSSFDCAGGNPVAAVDGVATFTGCAQTVPAAGYAITASASGLPDLVGSSFDIPGITFVKVIDNWAAEQGSAPVGEFTLTYSDEASEPVAGTAHSGDRVALPLGDYVVGEDGALPQDFAIPEANVQCEDSVTHENAGDADTAYLSAEAPEWTCTVHNVYSVPVFSAVIVGGSAHLADFTFVISGDGGDTTVPGSELVPSTDGKTGTYYGGALVGPFTITQTATPSRYVPSYEMDGLVTATECGWTAGETWTAPPMCTITNRYVASGPAPVMPSIALAVSANPPSLTGPGSVGYTYRITNPGPIALGSVSIADQSCSPATYSSGDTNSDQMLQPGETWVYACSATLSATTTSSVTASGTGNGFKAVATASVTVTVGTAPGLVAVTLTDGIAPGLNTGTTGFGTRSLVVPRGNYVTVLGRTDPNLAGALVEVWVKSKTTDWHRLTLRLVATDGTVHYFTRVNGWTGYWLRFAGDATHAPAKSHGRIATNPTVARI